MPPGRVPGVLPAHGRLLPQTMAASDLENLGIVIARRQNLRRIVTYRLKRAEFVIFDPGDRDFLQEYVRQHNLRFSIHTPLFFDSEYPENPLLACLVDHNQDRRLTALDLMIENVSLASEMGAEFVVVHVQRPEQFAGQPPADFDAPAALVTALAGAEVLAKRSRETGVPVLIENLMDNSTFYTADQYLAVLERFPKLGFCLDVGHLDMDARRFGIDFWDFIDRLAPHTREIHMHNSAGPKHPTAPRPWKIPVHPSQTPGPEWVDIEAVLRHVLAVRPDCVINFEFRPDKDQDDEFLLEGIDWIRDILLNGIGGDAP